MFVGVGARRIRDLFQEVDMGEHGGGRVGLEDHPKGWFSG